MAQPHAASGDVVHLQPLAAQLKASRTTAILKSRQLELARIVLPAGKDLHEHRAPGEITVLCLEGTIEFTTPAGVQRLQAGDLIHLGPGVPHALHAVDDASALLTICLQPPAP
jgi:quercetin dioxygenase-like cupin family protein